MIKRKTRHRTQLKFSTRATRATHVRHQPLRDLSNSTPSPPETRQSPAPAASTIDQELVLANFRKPDPATFQEPVNAALDAPYIHEWFALDPSTRRSAFFSEEYLDALIGHPRNTAPATGPQPPDPVELLVDELD